VPSLLGFMHFGVVRFASADRQATIITIDAPGAGTSAGQGTSTIHNHGARRLGRMQAQHPSRAPRRTASTRRGRSRASTMTPTTFPMASCALATGPSPHSTRRALGHGVSRARGASASIRRGRSRETTLHPPLCFTPSCALPTAPSPRNRPSRLGVCWCAQHQPGGSDHRRLR